MYNQFLITINGVPRIPEKAARKCWRPESIEFGQDGLSKMPYSSPRLCLMSYSEIDRLWDTIKNSTYKEPRRICLFQVDRVLDYFQTNLKFDGMPQTRESLVWWTKMNYLDKCARWIRSLSEWVNIWFISLPLIQIN